MNYLSSNGKNSTCGDSFSMEESTKFRVDRFVRSRGFRFWWCVDSTFNKNQSEIFPKINAIGVSSYDSNKSLTLNNFTDDKTDEKCKVF